MRRYAAEVSGVDDGVGRIMETLSRHGLDEKTLVIFTGDQGLSGGHNRVWGMGDHCRPLNAFDSTMHVPLIYRHPPRIPAGATSEILTSNYDVLPTLLGYLGLGDRMADRPESPGRDYSAVLSGEKIDWENVVYYEYECCRTIRTADWKLTLRRFPDGPDELYHLEHDPDERYNLAGKAEHAEIQRELERRLYAFFERYADPKYDLWGGGGSKSHLITRRKKGP
jgi:arylsulfatase A-like enzyme